VVCAQWLSRFGVAPARRQDEPWTPNHASRITGEIMTGHIDPTLIDLTVFVLAVFVGYHVIWNVTPALHTPLMSVTNAISSVIIVGAILAAGVEVADFGAIIGGLAVGLAAVNVFGGFLVTQRMLQMFKRKAPKEAKREG
jgi:H+-translocating NAD(P) transhydrogenase subunit alpha